AKKTLGKDVVAFYHREQAAREARSRWEKEVSGGGDPADISEVSVPAAELSDGKVWICRLLVLLGMVSSNNEARRLVQPGGGNVGPNREQVVEPKANVPVADGLVVRVGKGRIARVRLK